MQMSKKAKAGLSINCASSARFVLSKEEEEAAAALERYNPSNRLLTREFVEKVLSQLCGYGLVIGSLDTYQIAFVHKSVYRKDIAPPASVVSEYLQKTGLVSVPATATLEPPLGTFRRGGEPVLFTQTYETMEFVGDGWIGAIIGEYVFNRFPDQSEKFYHNLKQHIVCKDGLSKLSASLGFGEYALLSPQAEELLTRKNPTLLEDIFEAFCCAVVTDLGVDVLRIIVKNLIESTIDFREAIINDNNYKDVLKRVCREHGWSSAIVYVDLGNNNKVGAKKEYSVGIKLIPEALAAGVNGKTGFVDKDAVTFWATGTGPVKKKAQQAAAFNALKALDLARSLMV
jgi:dsRNA-specific ribonuclease